MAGKGNGPGAALDLHPAAPSEGLDGAASLFQAPDLAAVSQVVSCYLSQVIDTPGILDRPLEERNTIEMQSITALAHLRACVLYVVDISEQCGYTLVQQAALFHSIKPLFSNKPVMIVCNKTDAVKLEDLRAEDRALVDEMSKEAARISNGGMPVEPGQSRPCELA